MKSLYIEFERAAAWKWKAQQVDPPPNPAAADISVSNYFQHRVCEAILYKFL